MKTSTEQIEEIKDKTIITVRPSAVNTNTASIAGNQTKIPVEQFQKSGNKLSISENGIKIGKGVSIIAVSANMNIQNVESKAGIRRLQIVKNNEIISNVTTYVENVATYTSLVQSKILLEVQENDIIYLAHSSATVGDVVARGYTGTIGATFMTVETVC